MNVVPPSNIHEHLGPVVPVDDQSSTSATQLTLKVPRAGHPGAGRRGSSSGPVSPSGSAHKLIVGTSDEHHILTTPGGQR